MFERPVTVFRHCCHIVSSQKASIFDPTPQKKQANANEKSRRASSLAPVLPPQFTTPTQKARQPAAGPYVPPSEEGASDRSNEVESSHLIRYPAQFPARYPVHS